MTTPSPTARAGETDARVRVPSGFANNDSPDAVVIHDGEIWMWMDGIFGPVSRSDAAGEALYLANSPFPASRRRAEAITNALRETRQ